MRPDRVANPGPLAHESDALSTALRGPAENGACIYYKLPGAFGSGELKIKRAKFEL